MDKKQKLRAINGAIKGLEKQLKQEGVCVKLGDTPPMQYDVISSGILALDLAIGCRGIDPDGNNNVGIARGRIYEIYGAESSGKSLICQKIIGEFQSKDLICAYIDAEMTFAPDFAEKLGVNTDELYLSQPNNMEDAFTIMDALIDSQGVDCIVLDSIAALAPKAELDGEIGKQTMALVARVMSPFLRRIIPKCAKNNVTVFFINQIRDNVGVLYGNPVTTPGGKSLKFYSSVRLEVSKVGGTTVTKKIGGEDVVTSHDIKVKVTKNKLSQPFRKAQFTLYYDGSKSDRIRDLAELCLLKGIIPRYSADGKLNSRGKNFRFEFDGEVLAGKSREQVIEELYKMPKIQDRLLEILTSGEQIEQDMEDQESEEYDEYEYDDEYSSEISEAEEIESWDNV